MVEDKGLEDRGNSEATSVNTIINSELEITSFQGSNTPDFQCRPKQISRGCIHLGAKFRIKLTFLTPNVKHSISIPCSYHWTCIPVHTSGINALNYMQ